MSTWHALFLMFLVMESPWQATASATQARQPEPAKDVILISNNSPDIAKRTRDWTTQMLYIKDRNRVMPSRSHVFALDRALLAQLQSFGWDKSSSWFQVEKDDTISESDMQVYRLLFAAAMLCTVLAIVLLWLRVSLIRTWSLVTCVLSLSICGLMYLVVVRSGVSRHEFYVSRLVGRLPSAMFWLACAYVLLIAPAIEMFRNGGTPAMRIARVIMAIVIAVLTALVTFIPEELPAGHARNLPHKAVAGCLIAAGVVQTYLVYVTESSKTAWRVGPTLFLTLMALEIFVVSGMKMFPDKLSSFLLGIGELIYFVAFFFFSALAPFISDNKAPEAVVLGKYSSELSDSNK